MKHLKAAMLGVVMGMFMLASAQGADCPCVPLSAYQVMGHARLIACTNQPKGRFGEFVRLVSDALDLVCVFRFDSNLYCAYQENLSFTMMMPVTDHQYQACRQVILQMAHAQGIHCIPEFYP